MRRLPPLTALRAFEASGRHLSFTRAAEELRVSQGAVAQQVRALERILDTRLFDRRARGLTLTANGRRYLPAIRRAFDLIGDATEDLASGPAIVTLSATPSFASRWLVPRLGLLSETYPDLRVRIDATDRLADFQSDGVDLSVRQGRPPFGPDLVAWPLDLSDAVIVCRHDLADGPPKIAAPKDLAGKVLLQDSHGLWPRYLAEQFPEGGAPTPRTVSFTHTTLAIEAAIAGQGLALTPRILVEDALRDALLCEPLREGTVETEGFYVVAPRAPRRPAVTRRVRDWLLTTANSPDAETLRSEDRPQPVPSTVRGRSADG